MKKKIIVIAALLLAAAGIATWYLLEREKPPPPPISPERNLEQSLMLQNFKARGYYYLSQKRNEEALMFFNMASELDPNDEKLKEAIKDLEAQKTAPSDKKVSE